ncbi:hypothetical protein VQ643_16190, partial [Pseudomonas sp. F1_0610]|uniref:hypothetical protein n=1 Tax=Pseudomonas sp. F1_0610 TaxID=3114284 RepID=UPI0039C25995
YDEQGQLVSSTLPGNRTQQTQYDELGNITVTTDSLGNTTTQVWNIFGELTEVITANGNKHQFDYDANGNTIKEISPSSGITTYEYDAANQLIKSTNANGDYTTYEYDLAGNIIEQYSFAKGSSNAKQRISYRYDNAGQALEVKQTGDTHSTHRYHRDALGRVQQESITYGTGDKAFTKQLDYRFDNEGRLASLIYPDNSKVTYQYDKGLLKQSTLANGQHITWNSYQWLAPTQVSYPGATLKTDYDALLRPLTINVTGKNNSVLMNRIYQYTQAGNIGKRQTEKGHINYQYDPLDRLIEAKPDQALQALGLPDEGYTYD